jgi:hypothetical protein
VDSSAFITGSIDDCIVTMIQNTSGTRTLTALLTGVDNRNQMIRGKVSGYLVELVLSMSDELQGSTKELDSLLLKLSKLTQDSSPDARMNSREIIRLMLSNGLTTRSHMESVLTPDVVEKSMTPQASPKLSTLTSPLHRTKKSFGTTRRASPHGSTSKQNSFSTPLNSTGNLLVSDQESGNLVVAGISPRGTCNVRDGGEGINKKGIASRRKPNNATTTPKDAAMSHTKKMSQNAQDSSPALVELPLLLLVSRCTVLTLPNTLRLILVFVFVVLQALSNKNWQERRDAVTHVTDHLLENFDVFSRAGKVEQCIERILEIFEDGSVKVRQTLIMYNGIGL